MEDPPSAREEQVDAVEAPPTPEPTEPPTSTAPAVSADASSGKVAGQRLTALSVEELFPLRVRVRGGRTATWVSWGLLSAGTILLPTAFALEAYDPPSDWTKVGAYQRAFLRREGAANPLRGTAIAMMGVSIPVQTAGVMVEARALARVTGRRPTVGWVGTGLVISGLVVGGATTPIFPVPLFASPIVLSGWACIIAQWITNMRIEHGLDDRTRDLLYARRRPVELVVVPTPGPTPGLAVAGRF